MPSSFYSLFSPAHSAAPTERRRTIVRLVRPRGNDAIGARPIDRFEQELDSHDGADQGVRAETADMRKRRIAQRKTARDGSYSVTIFIFDFFFSILCLLLRCPEDASYFFIYFCQNLLYPCIVFAQQNFPFVYLSLLRFFFSVHIVVGFNT